MLKLLLYIKPKLFVNKILLLEMIASEDWS